MQYHSAEDFLWVYKGPKQEVGGDEQSGRPICRIQVLVKKESTNTEGEIHQNITNSSVLY